MSCEDMQGPHAATVQVTCMSRNILTRAVPYVQCHMHVWWMYLRITKNSYEPEKQSKLHTYVCKINIDEYISSKYN